MKKSSIIGMVLCIIAFATGLVLMLKGKIASETLIVATGVASFIVCNYIIGLFGNRDSRAIKPATKYRTQDPSHINHIMGL